MKKKEILAVLVSQYKESYSINELIPTLSRQGLSAPHHAVGYRLHSRLELEGKF
jgi:hypothetical protein